MQDLQLYIRQIVITHCSEGGVFYKHNQKIPPIDTEYKSFPRKYEGFYVLPYSRQRIEWFIFRKKQENSAHTKVLFFFPVRASEQGDSPPFSVQIKYLPHIRRFYCSSLFAPANRGSPTHFDKIKNPPHIRRIS